MPCGEILCLLPWLLRPTPATMAQAPHSPLLPVSSATARHQHGYLLLYSCPILNPLHCPAQALAARDVPVFAMFAEEEDSTGLTTGVAHAPSFTAVAGSGYSRAGCVLALAVVVPCQSGGCRAWHSPFASFRQLPSHNPPPFLCRRLCVGQPHLLQDGAPEGAAGARLPGLWPGPLPLRRGHGVD